jgi:hypothetical protein
VRIPVHTTKYFISQSTLYYIEVGPAKNAGYDTCVYRENVCRSVSVYAPVLYDPHHPPHTTSSKGDTSTIYIIQQHLPSSFFFLSFLRGRRMIKCPELRSLTRCVCRGILVREHARTRTHTWFIERTHRDG